MTTLYEEVRKIVGGVEEHRARRNQLLLRVWIAFLLLAPILGFLAIVVGLGEDGVRRLASANLYKALSLWMVLLLPAVVRLERHRLWARLDATLKRHGVAPPE